MKEQHPMRKANREIADKAGIAAIIGNCDVCRVAFLDAGHP
jgi:nitroimidazol reductase NimA-like FMN-containing flavoprotein (pyridoxamine 5'-phosphate oxidase superfamily)